MDPETPLYRLLAYMDSTPEPDGVDYEWWHLDELPESVRDMKAMAWAHDRKLVRVERLEHVAYEEEIDEDGYEKPDEVWRRVRRGASLLQVKARQLKRYRVRVLKRGRDALDGASLPSRAPGGAPPPVPNPAAEDIAWGDRHRHARYVFAVLAADAKARGRRELSRGDIAVLFGRDNRSIARGWQLKVLGTGQFPDRRKGRKASQRRGKGWINYNRETDTWIVTEPGAAAWERIGRTARAEWTKIPKAAH